jgi:hypothetical protein
MMVAGVEDDSGHLEAVGSGGGCAWCWPVGFEDNGGLLQEGVGFGRVWVRIHEEIRLLRSRAGHVEVWGRAMQTHPTTIDQEAASDGSPGGIQSFSYVEAPESVDLY